MAKDAKIGSLIGLVLIFIIAFVINGITRRGDTKDRTEPNSDTAYNRSDFNSDENSFADESIRRQIENNPPMETTGNTGPDASRSPIESTVPEPIPNGNPNVLETEAEKPTLSEVFYSVCEGDNLANIAKKFYGPEEGNKRANVLRIFLANQKVLASPDELFVGQKIVIPPLNADGSFFSDSLFETATSIGRNPLSNPDRTIKQGRLYAVKEGDSLWSISSALLGDGRRYKEISKLNAGILKDEDRLTVGMRLRIPAQ